MGRENEGESRFKIFKWLPNILNDMFGLATFWLKKDL